MIAVLPFGADTVSWRVDLEPVVILGGGRALLLQVAHPSVAAGVEQHSDYEGDPYGRLFGTLDVMTKMLFGAPDVSRRQTAFLAETHRRVTGHTDGGVPYAAADPALLTWVWATLVDTALLMYETIFGSLNTADRERFYAEQHVVAAACGVPGGRVPETLDDFKSYMEDTVRATLCVTPAARAVAANVLSPPLPWFLRSGKYPARLMTVGLLPTPLRAGYGLAWGRHDAIALQAVIGALRAAMPLIPRALRERPLRAMSGPDPVRPPAFLRRAAPHRGHVLGPGA